MTAAGTRTSTTYRVRRYWIPSAVGSAAMGLAGQARPGFWVIAAALTAGMFGSWGLFGPGYERWRHIAPPPKLTVTKHEALEQFGVLCLLPLSLAVVVGLTHTGVGSPRLMFAVLYGVVLADGVVFWLFARRWRQRESAR